MPVYRKSYGRTATKAFSAGVTVESIGTKNQSRAFKRNLIRFKILYGGVYGELINTMKFYSEGNFESYMESLPNMLSYTEFNNYDTNFYLDSNGDEVNNNSIYDIATTDELKSTTLVNQYRTLTNQVINNLRQGMSEYQRCTTIMNERDELKKYKEILEDSEKLREYLNQRQNEHDMFSLQANMTVIPILKPWFAEYFRLYGAPNEGVFDAEKLGDIIIEMRNDLERAHLVAEIEYTGDVGF
tara:strand:- start:9482 stop:10207 length:726 start_codon:yes stop_codon:yes gene_type:complete